MCKETEGEAERLRAALRKIRDGGFVSSPTAMAIARSALAGRESDDQWIADAESGKDREVPGNWRYKLAGTEAKATK